MIKWGGSGRRQGRGGEVECARGLGQGVGGGGVAGGGGGAENGEDDVTKGDGAT